MDLLHRPALGRIALHGELYNAHRDEFLGGTSIFRQPLPVELIRTVDDNFVKCDVKYSNSFSQRCDNLDVRGELKLSIFFGLVPLSGNGKYLLEESTSARACSISFLYQSKTKVEKLNIFGDEVRKLISTDVLENVEATHIVTEIEWGANATMTMNFSSTNEKKNENAAGEMQATLKFLGNSVKGGAAAEFDNSIAMTKENFDLHFFSDVYEPTEPVPRTFDECIAHIRRISALVRGNEGKGRPISYTMVSIPMLRLVLGMEPDMGRLCKMVDEHTTMSIFNFFEDLHKEVEKLCDLYEDVSKNSALFSEAMTSDICKRLQEAKAREAGLRRTISEFLVLYRRGQKAVADINAILEDPSTLTAQNVRQILNEFSMAQRKISFVERLREEGVKILLNRPEVDEFIASGSHYVLFCSMLAADDTVSANRILFDNLCRQKNNQCAVVDLDVCDGFDGYSCSRISEYMDGVEIESDLLALNELLKKFNVLKFTSHSVSGTMKTLQKSRAEIDCPGSFTRGRCEHRKRRWICYHCRTLVSYGFDGNFYCVCGQTPATFATYRCSDNLHGPLFVSFSEYQLQRELKGVEAFPEYNILLIGETGSGKSTWINSIFNYLSYETLEEASKHELKYLIPSTFSVQTKNAEMTTIYVGSSQNEVFNEGESATQKPSTYSFSYENKLIRFIDVPGIGDTRGPEQDKRNFDLILQELQHFTHLNAICILLTPDSSRLTVSFKYCLSELLTHLHRSAAKNIIFCFTKTRQTFYKAGQTLSTLKSYLAKFKNERKIEIVLSEDNMYYFDNEAFKFLCAEKNGIDFDEHRKNAFSESWDISGDETFRFLKHMLNLEPHRTREMLSLSEARRVIISISPVLASIAENIDTNIRVALQHKKECESLDERSADLESHLKIKMVTLVVIPLDYPRTVCAGKNCISVKSLPHSKENAVHYQKVCHSHCYLRNIELGKYPQPGLMNCNAMQGGKCKNCGCVWDVHLHIDYDQQQEETVVIDETTQRLLSESRDRKMQKQILLEQCDRHIRGLRDKQERITKICAKFGTFLRNNCIVVYNDALIEYLNYAISLAKEEAAISNDRSRMNRLQGYLNSYKEELAILQQSITNGAEEDISLEDIFRMKQELFELEEFGEKIKTAILATEHANIASVRRTEKVVRVEPDLRRQFRRTVSNGVKKAANLFSWLYR